LFCDVALHGDEFSHGSCLSSNPFGFDDIPERPDGCSCVKFIVPEPYSIERLDNVLFNLEYFSSEQRQMRLNGVVPCELT
jgi:hypothetical protein